MRANLRRLEHSPWHWNIFPGIISRTALATQHLIRRAPSDKMAVISTLVLILYLVVEKQRERVPWRHQLIPKSGNYGENFLNLFSLIFSVIAIRVR